MRRRLRWKRWIWVLIWMGVIFGASADPWSGEHSSRILAPIIRWLIPDISEPDLWRLVWLARKAAHVTEYAILAVLCWHALQPEQPRPDRAFSWSHAGIALGVAFAYALTDEFHQRFVPSRGASWLDVLLDTGGAALGLSLVWCYERVRIHIRR